MCWCTPESRTPICVKCPPEKKAAWPADAIYDPERKPPLAKWEAGKITFSQEPAGLRVGCYTITQRPGGAFYIAKDDGEGMGISGIDLAEAIRRLWADKF